MRKKNPVSIFNISFLDIMTTLILIAIILLFSVGTLFSTFPYTEKYMSEIGSLKNDISRLIDIEDSLATEIDNSSRDYSNRQYYVAFLVNDIGLSKDYFLRTNEDDLISEETARINNLSQTIVELDRQIRKLNDQVGVLRSRFVKRRYEWLKEMMTSDIQRTTSIKAVPVFYSVSGSGITDFEMNKRVSIEEVIKKHVPIKNESYPLFIIEKSGFYRWRSLLITAARLAFENEMYLGYEPYSKDLDVIYENFFIKKP